MDDERKDELDFESIQRMFARRDAERELRRKEEAKNQEVSERRQRNTGKVIPLRSEPEYDRMHARNINITPKGKKHASNGKLILAVGVCIAIAIGGIAYGISNHTNEAPVDEAGIIYVDESYHQEESDIISPEQCDLSNIAIIVRRSTPNTGGVVDTATRELTEMGVDSRSITSSQDLISVVNDIKTNSPNKQIVVINVDGEVNNTSRNTVIMTNYDNNAKSADTFAIAIQNANEDIYGINSDIRCGKKLSNGNRGMTSVETALKEAGFTDVICLTVAPSADYLADDVYSNNIATSIAESVIRVASLSPEERYADLIRRVQGGDTISQLAVDNDVSESYIRSVNSETLSDSNGLLRSNAALIVSTIPKNLTGKMSIDNKSITTNPNDVSNVVSYYIVQPGDTVTAIADELNISPSELVIPSGDADKINVGDKLGYETTTGPILVSKTQQTKK